jgi:lipopolysaccharide/colanic/teichoic acid biosynthesis glycosyltransferase
MTASRRLPREAKARRAIDIIVALAALLVAAPLMLVIACAIRVETPGPVFFTQRRLGKAGHKFTLFKFRKFRNEPNASGRAVTLRNDPRMTRIGKLLERTKLDELPQLWNVAAGQMSLVGPRPETLNFADCFAGSFGAILDYTPGLFGPSQAIFRDEAVLYPAGVDPHAFYRAVLFPAKARIDLSYYQQRTLWSDFGWVVRCMLAVFGLVRFQPGEMMLAELHGPDRILAGRI